MTSSTSVLVTGFTLANSYRSTQSTATRLNIPHTRTRPIRQRPLGMNRSSLKYLEQIPIESALGTLIQQTGWVNVVSIHNRIFTNLSRQVHCTTYHMEMVWFLLQASLLPTNSVWYVLELKIFWLLHVPQASLDQLYTWYEEGDLCMTTIEGAITFDSFCKTHKHQPSWLLFNALSVLIPTYMCTHNITVATVSNRRRRC